MRIRTINAAKIACATIAACGTAAAAPAQNEYTTSYQIDPAHDGNITFTTSFEPPLQTAWSLNLGGEISYPIVADGLAIVSVSPGTSNPGLLVAVDLTTGAIRWEKASPAGYLAYGGGRLFFTDFDGPLQAFAPKIGRPLWSTQLPFQSFFNFVPIAVGGSVYTGGDESGTTVYQVDGKTGKVGWTQELDGGGAGPTLGPGAVYFAVPCDVPAYALATGNVIWNYNSGCDGGGGAVAAYYRGRVYAPGVNLETGVILDSKNGNVDGNLNSNFLLPAFHGNFSYAITNGGVISTNLKTGNVGWFQPISDSLGTPPIVVNGTVFVLSETGVVYALNSTTGTVLQKLSPGLGGGSAGGYDSYSGLGAGQGYLVVPSGDILAAYTPSGD
jgi:outer membrane protein assembly factor BamB